jgi:MFS family permease
MTIFRKKLNYAISTLVLSDLFLYFGLGLISPIFSIFVLDNIPGATLSTIGTSVAIYWLARIFSVIPISWLLDAIKGEKDEYYAVVVGTTLLAIIPLCYIFASKIMHLYLIEFFKGVANSLIVPAWRVLFTRFANKNQVGFSWSLADLGVGVATATSAYAGSVIAQRFGFKVLFVMVSLLSFVAAYYLTKLYKESRIHRSADLLDSIKQLVPFQND